MLWNSRIKRRRRTERSGHGLLVESLEERCLLSGTNSSLHPHTLVQNRLDLPDRGVGHSEISRVGSARSAGLPRAAGTRQLLPDLMPLASYLNDWNLDTTEMPGHTLLRLSNGVEDAGAGPLELRGGTTNPDGTQQVFQRIYNSDGTFSDRLAGTFVFHPEHGHIHFEDYAQYNLRAVTADGGVGDIVAAGQKTSFCLLDVDHANSSLRGTPSREHYNDCGQFQGISVGWADVYDSGLPEQWIDITGVADGNYWLESVVDPSNRIVESDESNNIVRVQISLGPPPPDDFPNTFELATPIALSPAGVGTQSGLIGEPNDVDMFSVVAPKRGRLTINQISPGGLDSFLIVYNASTQEIARNDDISNGNLNSQVRIRVQAGQKLFVQAGGFSTDTGPYELTMTMARGRQPVVPASGRRITIKNLMHDPFHPLDG